ncbi:MAG: ferritin-like domain-containing protein [Sphingobacteriales bacterium]|jgi:ferritin-like metal-binding protein YciE
MAKQSKGTTKAHKPVKSSSKVPVIQKQTEMHSMMEKFFWDQLRDLYYVEKNQIKALGRMAKKATTEELKDIFIEHQETTQEQLNRLDEVFEIIGKRAQTRRCPAFDGLVNEMDENIRETEDDSLTRDVGLIISAQKIEHYEIAGYGSLTTLARTYGMIEVADILQESLDEEKDNDLQLTYIAENSINYEAGMEEE